MNIFKELAKFNVVKFHDAEHKYFIGEQELTSGTAFVGQFKEKFDSEGQSIKSAKKKGISAEEMLAEWEFKGDFSRTKGTLLHNYAENYWQNKIYPLDYNLPIYSLSKWFDLIYYHHPHSHCRQYHL
jgi:hypothetical protein